MAKKEQDFLHWTSLVTC